MMSKISERSGAWGGSLGRKLVLDEANRQGGLANSCVKVKKNASVREPGGERKGRGRKHGKWKAPTSAANDHKLVFAQVLDMK